MRENLFKGFAILASYSYASRLEHVQTGRKGTISKGHYDNDLEEKWDIRPDCSNVRIEIDSLDVERNNDFVYIDNDKLTGSQKNLEVLKYKPIYHLTVEDP